MAVALAERLREFPPGGDRLVFTSRERKPLARTYYNQHIWKQALEAAGIALRVYTHLIPSSEDRARAAIDRVLSGVSADSPRTATPTER